MNTKQTAKLTGIPESLLIRMRSRETRTLKSGPPYAKKLGKNGEVIYVYSKSEVVRWLKCRRCIITAGDAASILGSSRDEILLIHGIQSIDIGSRGFKGKLLIDVRHNLYIWLPKNEKRPFVKNMRTA